MSEIIMQDIDYKFNTISENGLRYKKKESASTFSNTVASHNSTMSCLLCGEHVARSNGSIKKIFGSSSFVCYVCRPG